MFLEKMTDLLSDLYCLSVFSIKSDKKWNDLDKVEKDRAVLKRGLYEVHQFLFNYEDLPLAYIFTVNFSEC